MTEWWTYEPRDLLMFAPETYYRLFELLNADIWPAQIVALAAGLFILAALVRRPAWAGRAVSGLLALAWAFVAFAYFAERYATINLAAPYYAYGFAAQALLFLVAGIAFNRLTFSDRQRSRAGLALFAGGLLVYPLMAAVFGRPWSQVELFGVAPDPTVFCTFGVLIAADRMRWPLMVIPVLWAAITGVTLWTMGAPDAFITGAAALYAVAVALFRFNERGGGG